jgi:dihydropteroate synthase
MGILNRTRDSFYDRDAHWRLDALLRRADQLVDDGADLLDIGSRPGGVGVQEVSEAEETDLVAETVTAVAARFDVPISVDTTRATVARAGFTVGAVLGNDMSGFRDPGYLRAAARAGASVVATHIRQAYPTPTRSTTTSSRTCTPRSAGSAAGPATTASAPTGSSSTPASTSARLGNSRCTCLPG